MKGMKVWGGRKKNVGFEEKAEKKVKEGSEESDWRV